MKHQKKGRKFGREKDQRNALLNLLVSSLIIYEKITTTKAKAKEASSYAEKLITAAKKANLASIKKANSCLSKEAALKIKKLAETKFQDRNSGYTRIVSLGKRKTDAAEMAVLELV